MSISKGGAAIKNLLDWERLGPPKSQEHWVDGRSAKEAARAWLSGGDRMPSEVDELLTQHADFGSPLSWEGEPEVRLRFDSFSGEPRNSDLVVQATDGKGRPYLIAVEAKADEPFGELVSDALAAALEARLENPRSNALTRISQLSEALLGPRGTGDKPLNCIRYQLLTACAGAIAEAGRRGCDRTLLLIQEFHSWKTTEVKITQNGTDLDRFISRLSHGAVCEIRAGQIVGPFRYPRVPLFSGEMKLYIGKVTRSVAESLMHKE